MEDYEVQWAFTSRTDEARAVAIRDFAVSEYSGDPEVYSPEWTEESVAAKPMEFLEMESGGVLVTFEHYLQAGS